jgi:hypothetical protein
MRMRHERGIRATLAAAAVAAVGAACAATASGSVFADDTSVHFAAGTPGAGTAVVEVGSVRLKPATEGFDGTSLPVGLTSTPWGSGGTASVGAGVLAVDGARVQGATTYGPGEAIEFSARFSGAAAQYVGFGDTLEDGPWAIIGTGGGGGLGASTRAAPGATPTFDPISVLDPVGENTYRIEWSATGVTYYVNVDGVPKLIASRPVAIASQMRPIVSDYTADGKPVTVDSLARMIFPTSGIYESNVKDTGDPRAVWDTLNSMVSTPAGTALVLQTRSGNTATPDASWSGYQPLGAGNAIESPGARYIQYRALLSTANDHVTPLLERVDLVYDVDRGRPNVEPVRVRVRGATAKVTFMSRALDVARFECRLDQRAFATCTSPKTFSHLAVGTHRVSVRAIDRVGNVGPAVTSRFDIPRVLRVSRRGTVAMSVRCPAKLKRCKVTQRLRTGGRTVASRTVTVTGARARPVTLQLSKSARALLRKRGSLAVTGVATATDAGGRRRTTTTPLLLRPAAG